MSKIKIACILSTTILLSSLGSAIAATSVPEILYCPAVQNITIKSDGTASAPGGWQGQAYYHSTNGITEILYLPGGDCEYYVTFPSIKVLYLDYHPFPANYHLYIQDNPTPQDSCWDEEPDNPADGGCLFSQYPRVFR